MQYIVINKTSIFPRPLSYRLVKRLVDIGLCLIMLPAIVLIGLACALAIHLDSPGPIFFIQERMGKGGKLFRMYKFRTMQVNLDRRQSQIYMKAYIRSEITAPDLGKKTFKPCQDQDYFRVGRILRKFSLDELPQIINVLKGEMSIIGPRPNVLWEVEAYRPWHFERMEVLPGITGLAQVRGRSSIDFASLVRNDIEYIENQSILLDMKILWWTLLSALTGKGAE